MTSKMALMQSLTVLILLFLTGACFPVLLFHYQLPHHTTVGLCGVSR